MFPLAAVLAQETEAQQTEQAVTFLIILLLVVAFLLTLITIWYWRHTSPRRVRQRGGRGVPTIDLDDPRLQQSQARGGYGAYDDTYGAQDAGGGAYADYGYGNQGYQQRPSIDPRRPAPRQADPRQDPYGQGRGYYQEPDPTMVQPRGGQRRR
ncbi:MAG: hypothetical protein AAGA59_25025 [Actinomycetota bacterium]